MVFIGIDVTAGRHPLTYAVLNNRLHIERLDDGKPDDVIQLVESYPASICAIDAPGGFNRRLLDDADYRRRAGLDPDSSQYRDYRVCEYELRKRGINIYHTPFDSEQAAKWMKTGWELYNRLRQQGYVDYPAAGTRRLFEIYPYAAFCALIGRRPYKKTSFEGLVQRQVVLYENGVEVPDAMGFLQEWTRHRIVTGQLPTNSTYRHDQLDALVAAYTAFLAEREPHNVMAVGDPAEGQIVLPVNQLKDWYE